VRIRRTVAAFLFSTVIANLFPATATSQEPLVPVGPVAELPSHLSDEAFWQMIEDFSETEGQFPSDNFVSNETRFQRVIPELQKNSKPGGGYLGVGPEQNFTYIAAMRPKIVFIIDIRRQNLIQHLLYKALFELSRDRADFLSQLFSRPRPNGVGPTSTAAELFKEINNVEADGELFKATLRKIKKHLVENHGFPLSAGDEVRFNYLLRTFFEEGPQISYDSGERRSAGFRTSPTYAELMMQTDGNQNRSYLASEEDFRLIQDLEKRNLIVPLVGNFAGNRTIRRVGQYLRYHNVPVTAFYLSNVEQYLFQQRNDWRRFYSNMETLPVDSTSTFIRSFFYPVSSTIPRFRYNDDSVSLLCSIEDLLDAFRAGEIIRYYDIIEMSY
jgi:hypothetical protein